MRCLLVDTGQRVILIDNGIGDKQEEKFLKNYYLNGEDTLERSLAKYGYNFISITDVILTHLHFDHCGGSVKYNENRTKLEPAFPNANFWVSKQQWDWAVNPNNREKASFLSENILPIKESGKLKLIEKDNELYPGIKVRLYHGHTDGQMIPFIENNGKTLVFMADLLPAVAHIPLPYIMSYDTRPLITLKEKEVFLKEAADNGYILFFEHDLYNECCTVQHTDKGVRVKASFLFHDIFVN
jgi:glyoxylase-like metal-dependent hydrolase (beta-lactamase superfamily II)